VGRRAENLATFVYRFSRNSGKLEFLEPYGPVEGLLVAFIVEAVFLKISAVICHHVMHFLATYGALVYSTSVTF
jgi:hypothetical protein